MSQNGQAWHLSPAQQPRDRVPDGPSLLGRRLGSYLIERALSSSASGSVFAARHVHLNREVAVRFLAPELQGDAEFPKRFVSEARSLAKLQHHNLLEVLDIGEVEGRSYYVSEFGRGQSLRAALRARSRLTPAEVVRYLGPVCEALGAAHEAGLVHRDLRPEHVFVHEAGGLTVKLGGFGSTPLLPSGAGRTGAQVLSSPRYAAPEQANLELHQIPPVSDLYALGAIAFELLTGKPVFEHASDLMLLVMHLRDPVPKLREHVPEVPEELAEVIERCLSKHTEARPPSAAALARELGRLQDRAAPAEREREAREIVDLTQSMKIALRAGPPPSSSVGRVPVPPAPDAAIHELVEPQSGRYTSHETDEVSVDSRAFPESEGTPPSQPEPLDTPLGGTAQSTVKKLRLRMQRKGDFPAFSQNVGEVSKRADAASIYSASQLGASILNDFALTAKLLRVVNSTYANRFGGKIYRVQHAIVILGFDRIRSLALGISLFKSAGQDPHAARIAESAVGSLVSGEIARQLARDVTLNDEEAMVCAMFRNLGRHLVLIYLPEMYDQILQVMAKERINLRHAAEKVLGLSFGRLGVEIAESWHLPSRMVTAIASAPTAGSNPVRAEDRLNALSEFASEVCELIANEPAPSRKAKLGKLLLQYKDFLKLTPDELLERLASVEQAFLDRYSNVLGPELKKSRLLAGVSQLVPPVQSPEGALAPNGRGNAPPGVAVLGGEEPEAAPKHVVPVQIAKPQNAGRAPTPEQMTRWEARFEQLRTQVRTGLSGDRLLSAALKLASEILGLERLLVLATTGNKAELSVRFGFRDDLEAVAKELRFPIYPTRNVSVFYSAYHSGRDVVITDAFSPKATASIPVSYYEVLGSPAFALYGCFGKGLQPCLLLAEASSGAELPTPERVQLLGELRTWIAQGAASRS
ncbi:MAG TPA: HDOD domain-containing protein [Polyangiaceae bacterium]|nr:HDOD domain-containing protein [Polyangiaceae bacterium]